jgi:AAA+ superfamily predicted ATPase
MTRSDLLLSLARAGTRGDTSQARRTLEAIVAEERAKKHHILADRLAENLSDQTEQPPMLPPRGTERQSAGLWYEIDPRVRLDDLILPAHVRRACDELVEEQHRTDLLRSYGLEPRHRVLLAGPPGNGKTSVAEGLADALARPLLAVRYEGVIGSFLGETSSRIAQLFANARTRRCVLFFDEFDTIGKERGDIHETGEIKRVVSSLLLQIDSLPSHVVVVCASNHPELLDRAVWRRFQLRLELPMPSALELSTRFVRFAQSAAQRFGQGLGFPSHVLSRELAGASYAEVEEFGLDVMRRAALSQPSPDLPSIVGGRMDLWKSRFKAPPVPEAK